MSDTMLAPELAARLVTILNNDIAHRDYYASKGREMPGNTAGPAIYDREADDLRALLTLVIIPALNGSTPADHGTRGMSAADTKIA